MSSKTKDAADSPVAGESPAERPIDMSPDAVGKYEQVLMLIDDNVRRDTIFTRLDWCSSRLIEDAKKYRRDTAKPELAADTAVTESWQFPAPEKKPEPTRFAVSTVPAYQFKAQPKSEPAETTAEPVSKKPKGLRKERTVPRSRHAAAVDRAAAGCLDAAIKTQARRQEPATPASNPAAVKAVTVTPTELRDMSDIAKEVLDALVVIGETSEEVLRSREDDFRSKALRQAFVIFAAFREVDIGVAGSFLSRNLMSAQAIFRYGLETLRDEMRPTTYFVRQLCLKFDVQFNTLKKAYHM